MSAIAVEDIRYNKFFRNIDFDSLLFNRIDMNVCMLQQGELLYREGEMNKSVFLIVRGEINSIPSQYNSDNDSVIYSENDFFGANEYASNLPRGESAIAIRDTYLVELPEEAIADLIKQSDEILSTIYNLKKQSINGDNVINNTANQVESESKNIAINETTDTSEILEEPIIPGKTVEEHENTVNTVIQEPNPIIEKESEIKKEETAPKQYRTEMTFEQLDRINKAAHLVNSNVKIDDVLKNIIDVSVSICDADRGTLYLVDKSKNELWSKILQGNEPRKITLKMGNGFAGWAAANKEVVNIKEARLDERFNDAFDKSSGYTTKSVLCFPVKNKNDVVVGVIQLLNSKNGAFTKLDENFLYALSTNVALALQNADLVEQLLKTERISSLGKMANFLIEDIKKPILVSKRYAEHLKKKDLSADVVNVIDMLLDQLNGIADLVQSTSNYSEGKSVLESNSINLNEALDEFVDRADSYIHTMQCEIEKNYDADIAVSIDTKEFYQGFKHIIKNACEAMPEGGKISLSTKNNGDKALIIISDEGSGIPAGFTEKIFEPFMTYGKKSGTGLGLSVTKKIVEEHNGSISANSNAGVGSTIVITLPVA